MGRIAWVLIDLGGLYLLRNGYRGIALNDCVRSADAVADAILTPAGAPDFVGR